MKHLKKFNNENAYNSFIISDIALSPNISFIKDNTSLIKYHIKQDLPLKYTELEYIESSGSNYIELETLDKYVTDTSSDARFNLKIKTQFIASGYDNHNQACIVGCTSDKIMYIRKSDKILQFRLFNASKNITTQDILGSSVQNTTITIYDSNNINISNDDFKQYSTSGINNFKLFLFCSGLSIKRFSQARIYYYKIWQNNDLILDIVPVYNNATKQQGVYDKILNKFYPLVTYTE